MIPTPAILIEIWPIYSYNALLNHPDPPPALSRVEALTLAKQHLKTCVVSRGG